MSFSLREEKRGDRLLDVLTDEDAGVRIIVSRLGAELVSLARRDARGEWVGFLYRDNDLTPPAKGWANHATVMGYFLHRLKNERSLYRGKPIECGSHGFLRHKVWPRVDADAAASGEQSSCRAELSYHMARPQFTATEYPLDVSLTLSYALRGEDLLVTFDFENHEREVTAHVGFGMHPGFATTHPSFRADCSGVEEPRRSIRDAATGSLDSARDDGFRFDMPAGLYRRHFSPSNFLSGETEDIRHEGGDMPFPKEKLAGSYILELLDVPERSFSFTDLPSGRNVSLDFCEVPYVTLWSDGGPFLCVEPCWGLTDHEQQRAFEEKEGIQTIDPGGSLRRSVSVRPSLNS
ncbi:MAG: hypothetical protein M3032_07420 [Verrucomicrobiota bacterium]|nr:hypothetical protein [Verrucomicrobiota bacterium]